MITPLPLISSVLGIRGGRTLARFSEALFALEAREAEGLITATEFADIKDGFNRGLEEAWIVLIKNPFNYTDKNLLTQAEQEFSWVVYSPTAHLTGSYLKRALKLAPTDYSRAVVSFLSEALPVAERINALKQIVGKRPAPKSAETIRREGEAMTCQCCGRAILANLGKIAHHGYTRPGDGWQTASCPGAKELPFEVSRDALAGYIAGIVAYRDRLQTNLVGVQAETLGVHYNYDLKTFYRGTRDKAYKEVTRDTLATVAQEVAEVRHGSRVPSYDELKANTVATLNRNIRLAQTEIDHQQARYDGWAGVTHEWTGKAWKAVGQ